MEPIGSLGGHHLTKNAMLVYMRPWPNGIWVFVIYGTKCWAVKKWQAGKNNEENVYVKMIVHCNMKKMEPEINEIEAALTKKIKMLEMIFTSKRLKQLQYGELMGWN